MKKIFFFERTYFKRDTSKTFFFRERERERENIFENTLENIFKTNLKTLFFKIYFKVSALLK